MSKFTFLACTAVALFFSSCGADQVVVDKMCDEMCAAMDKYKEDDPMTMLSALSSVTEVVANEKEYGDVTESQFKETMEKKCPDGYKKFLKMTETGKE